MDSTVTTWLAQHAHPVNLTDPIADLEPLDDLMTTATVVGLGETTRASREVLHLGLGVLRYLVERHGFRGLVIQDDRSVFADLNRWVHGDDSDVTELLKHAWIPWQNTTTIEILQWIRDYNAAHPADPVSLYGLSEPSTRPADYDRVVEAVAELDPGRANDVREHYAVIRTAHKLGEHVQLARGIHPGRPFVEHARQARDLVATLVPVPESVVTLTERIVGFHANSIAGGYDFAGMAAAAAAETLRLRKATGQRLAYWEGIAHTSVSSDLNMNSLSSTFASVGAHLRAELGDAYVSLYIGFEHGEIHDGERVPKPAADFVDSYLSTPEPDTYLVNLHHPAPEAVTRWLNGEHKIRVIAGVYNSDNDADHYIAANGLDTMFDAIIRTRTITPTEFLD